MRLGRLLATFPVIAFLFLGCTGKSQTPAKLSGTIKYKDQVVKGGSIRFHDKEGGTYRATIMEDGSYSKTDLPVGEMAVSIETESINPGVKAQAYGGRPGMSKAAPPKGKGPDPAAGEMKNLNLPPMPSEADKQEHYVKIPAKYSDPAKSELKVTLTTGSQTKDFTLTD
jgi:hypothetical protein